MEINEAQIMFVAPFYDMRSGDIRENFDANTERIKSDGLSL